MSTNTNRTIVVKGIGKVTIPPDYIELEVKIREKDQDYKATIEKGSRCVKSVIEEMTKAGIPEDNIKTIDYRVDTDRYSKKDFKGDFHEVKRGYICCYELRISFDLDMDRLSSAIGALTRSISDPDFSINFTLKDKETIKKDLLISAVQNAKSKAETLVNAAGEHLGSLLNISYDWGELSVYSGTRLEIPSFLRREDDGLSCDADYYFDEDLSSIHPDDIKLRDTVAIVWEIE